MGSLDYMWGPQPSTLMQENDNSQSTLLLFIEVSCLSYYLATLLSAVFLN